MGSGWEHIRETAEMNTEATLTHVALSQEAASDGHPNEEAMGTEVWTRYGRGSSKKQAKEDRFPWSGDIQRPLNLTTRGVWKRLRKAEVRQENSEAAAQLGSHGTTTASK